MHGVTLPQPRSWEETGIHRVSEQGICGSTDFSLPTLSLKYIDHTFWTIRIAAHYPLLGADPIVALPLTIKGKLLIPDYARHGMRFTFKQE
jgi:hypothetical protein